MHANSPYKPYRTGERTAPVSNDLLSRHRNALFEQLRADTQEKRADTLLQIDSNLAAWTKIAYPKDVPPDRSRESSVDPERAALSFNNGRRESPDCVFSLDSEDEWVSEKNTDSKNGSCPSLLLDVRPQTPPWSETIQPHQEPGYGDYSMYGAELTIFHGARPKNELREILKSYLLSVLRASSDCPFADVRRYCRFILQRVYNLGACVPELICESPSWLIPAIETVAFGHDVASERPLNQMASRTHIDDTRTRGSWVSSSFHSDMSDLDNQGSLMKRNRSGVLTPGQSPSKNHVRSPNAEAQDLDDIVFESDDGEDEKDSLKDHSLSNSTESHPSPRPAPSAIPISNKKVARAPIDSSAIDDILLGPVETRDRSRKARFSLEGGDSKMIERPALGRKRTNSTTHTIHQRRASRNLRTFHLNCYFSTGRISNLGRILSYFPRFYESTIVLHDELIRKQGGPLQRVTKLYLSIMAAAQCSCQYFVSYFAKKFLQLGQNPEWIEGLHKAPRKIQRLGKINALLAHQPWRLRQEDIEELLGRSKESIDNGDLSDQWTMGELVQTICILVVVNCQAHFCLAVGLVPEPDTFGGACIKQSPGERTPRNVSVNVLPLFTSYDSRTYASPLSYRNSYADERSSIDSHSPCMVIPQKVEFPSETGSPLPEEVEEDSLPNRLWKRRQSFKQAKLWAPQPPTEDEHSTNEFGLDGIFAQCGIVEAEVNAQPTPTLSRSPFWAAANLVRKSPGTHGLLSPFPSYQDLFEADPEAATMPVNPVLEDMSRFYDSTSQLLPEDFDLRSKEYRVLRLADCNWEDHTCSLIGRFVPNLETVLDQNLQEAREAAGDEDDGFFFSSENGTVDQGPLRDAVWFFILRLYGIYNDGYEYRDVNLLLNKPAKAFLKKVCFTPEQINRSDWQSIGKGLKSQEKVLLALLASHARMYACLVYAFRYCQ